MKEESRNALTGDAEAISKTKYLKVQREKFATLSIQTRNIWLASGIIVTKYISLSTHYDSDMGLGAGVTITY